MYVCLLAHENERNKGVYWTNGIYPGGIGAPAVRGFAGVRSFLSVHVKHGTSRIINKQSVMHNFLILELVEQRLLF